MSKISLFPEGKFSEKHAKIVPAFIPFTNLEFDDYLDHIKDGEYQDEVLKYRTGKLEKNKLRGVTASGVFSYRSAKNLTLHSGFICIDIDAKDQIDFHLESTCEMLQKDPYVYAFHTSVSGFGLAIYIKVVPEKHLEAFLAIEKHFNDNYHVLIDKSCKDVSRYRFVSYDPHLYRNRKSRTWKSYLQKKHIEPRANYIHSNSDIEHVFQQIADKGIDLTNDYSDWFKIGASLYHKFQESGRDYFHLVSQFSPKYEAKAVDDLWGILAKRNADGIATIGTFLWLCKNAGIEIKTSRTETIERVAKIRRKGIGSNGGATDPESAKSATVKFLSEIEGIEGEDVLEVIDQVYKLDAKDLNVKSEDTLSDLKAFLKGFDIKFNEVTRNYEMNGEPMIDRDYNSLFIKALEQVDDRLSKDRFITLIDSDNTASYNPFDQFISKYKHLKPSGNFEKLCSCFRYKQNIFYEGKEHVASDYLEIFLKKWLLGIVSSIHGTYSLLVLVLTGGQDSGKTKFFRNLLPEELMSFYGESNLDDGKDSEILMTQKLIIMDDEFGGKSKQDAKKLKELSSKQWFNVRRPFGRTSEDLRRLAVLCGTSNEDEIINDPTGNRRIVPVNIISIDHEKMDEINRIDLFMELYHEWREVGDGWMLDKTDIELLNQCTDQNQQPSVEFDLVSKYFAPTETLGGNAVAMTNTEIKLHIESKNLTVRINTYKLGSVLKSMGFKKTSHRRHGNPTPINAYYVELL